MDDLPFLIEILSFVMDISSWVMGNSSFGLKAVIIRIDKNIENEVHQDSIAVQELLPLDKISI